MGVRFDGEGGERMGAGEETLDGTGLASPSGSQADMGPPEIVLRKPGFAERHPAGGQDRIPAQVRIEADVGGPADPLSETTSLFVAQTGAALGAAAVDANEQGFSHRQEGPTA